MGLLAFGLGLAAFWVPGARGLLINCVARDNSQRTLDFARNSKSWSMKGFILLIKSKTAKEILTRKRLVTWSHTKILELML